MPLLLIFVQFMWDPFYFINILKILLKGQISFQTFPKWLGIHPIQLAPSENLHRNSRVFHIIEHLTASELFKIDAVEFTIYCINWFCCCSSLHALIIQKSHSVAGEFHPLNSLPFLKLFLKNFNLNDKLYFQT